MPSRFSSGLSVEDFLDWDVNNDNKDLDVERFVNNYILIGWNKRQTPD